MRSADLFHHRRMLDHRRRHDTENDLRALNKSLPVPEGFC
jgi:hypothetical protein